MTMEESPVTDNDLPRKSVEHTRRMIEEAYNLEKSSGGSTQNEGQKAENPMQFLRETSPGTSKMSTQYSPSKNVTKSRMAHSIPFGTDSSLLDLRSTPTSVAPSDSLSDMHSLVPSIDYISSESALTDLDDLSDPSPSPLDVNTRPSTPDFVIESLKNKRRLSHTDSLPSPWKKRKMSRRRKLQAASGEARISSSQEKDLDYDSDDPPPYYKILGSQGTFAPKEASQVVSVPLRNKRASTSKQRRQSGSASNDFHIDEDDEHLLLTIPGEGILAKDGAHASVYWPARIDEYIPGTRKQKGKYAVTWLDKSTQNIPRAWFYTSQEEGFVTCKLGKFESAFSDDPDDDEKELSDFDRSASPEPLAIPLSPDEFSELPIRHQFVHTKNVLRAILNHTYQPAEEQHAKFMKGGLSRLQMGHQSSQRGLMDPRQVDQIQKYLIEWVLRDEKRAGTQELRSHIPTEIEGGGPGTGKNASTQLSVDNSWNIEHDLRLVSPLLTDTSLSSPPPKIPSDLGAVCRVQSELPAMSEKECVSQDTVAKVSPRLSSVCTSSAKNTEVPPGEKLPKSFSSLATQSVAVTEPTTFVDDGDCLKSVNIDDRQDDGLTTTSKCPPRQTGCAAYESLPALEKVDYCTSVLLPEAVRQILLWRSGDRKSVDLLSPEEEQYLHRKGQELLEKSDWVLDIIRLRRWEEKRRNKKLIDVPKGKHRRNESLSTRSRRKVPFVNYEE